MLEAESGAGSKVEIDLVEEINATLADDNKAGPVPVSEVEHKAVDNAPAAKVEHKAVDNAPVRRAPSDRQRKARTIMDV